MAEIVVATYPSWTNSASAWIDPGTVVDAILHVLDLPGDATLSDLSIRPR